MSQLHQGETCPLTPVTERNRQCFMGSLAEPVKKTKNEQMQNAFYYLMIIFNSMLFNFTLSANKATLMS